MPREVAPRPVRMVSSINPSSLAAGARLRKPSSTGHVHQIENGRYVTNRIGYKLFESDWTMQSDVCRNPVCAAVGHSPPVWKPWKQGLPPQDLRKRMPRDVKIRKGP